MSLLLILVVLFLLFGGGGYYGYRSGQMTTGSPLFIVVIGGFGGHYAGWDR